MTDDAPLILTLRFDEVHQALFDALRDAHFPRERNFLRAHVTLFHALPGEEIDGLAADLAAFSAQTPAPHVEVLAPYPLGRGVAYRLHAPNVVSLRKELAVYWRTALTKQDASFSGLHVTVQNKVEKRDALDLLNELSTRYSPSAFVSPGLDLWRYRGGPWSHAAAFEFAR